MRLDIGQRDWFGVGTSQPLVQIMGEMSVYDASADKTFIVWQGPRQRPNVTYYDHSALAWGPIVEISTLALPNDDHGAPSICQDASGYLHVFWGTHANPIKYAVSTNVRDISAWTVQANVSSGYTYQQPFIIGGNIFLVGRRWLSGTDYKISMVKSIGTAPGHSWVGSVDLVFFAGRMMYPSDYRVVGADIHFVFWRRENPTGLSQNIYYAVYETETGLLRNAAGATFQTPISEPTGNANFRVFDSLTDEANGPTLWMDNAGNPHIAFIHSNAGIVYLKHTRWDGSAWTTPVALASNARLWNNPCRLGDDLSSDLYWVNSTGDIKKTNFNPSDDSNVVTSDFLIKGAWPNGALKYIGPVTPNNSHPDLRMLLSEIYDETYWYEHVRIAAHGAGGFVQADGARHSYQIVMPFDEPAGATILKDYSGHGQDANNTSLILGVEGINGLTGAQLGGEATIPHTGAQWLFGYAPCTVRFWGKDLSGILLGKGRPNANTLRYMISLSTGQIKLNCKKTATWKTAISSAGLVFTGMHFYEIVWDGVNTMTFRADGLAWGTSNAIVTTDMLVVPTNPLDLGYAYNSGASGTSKGYGAGVLMGLTMLPRHQSTLAEHQAEWAALQADWGL